MVNIVCLLATLCEIELRLKPWLPNDVNNLGNWLFYVYWNLHTMECLESLKKKKKENTYINGASDEGQFILHCRWSLVKCGKLLGDKRVFMKNVIK